MKSKNNLAFLVKFVLLLLSGIFVVEIYLLTHGAILGSALRQAIQDNKTAKVVSLLESGADPNYVSDNASPLWHFIIEKLNMRPEAPTKGSTPLLIALRWRENELGEDTAPPANAETIKALVKYGANVNAADNDGMTPLMFAAWTGNSKSLMFLLSQGAAINAVDKYGYTSLMLACLQSQGAIVRSLLTNHAKANMKNVFGDTAFVLAERTGNLKILKMLHDN